MKRLAIIPAKSSSIRVKKKNFVLINNKPIYTYTLNNLIKSKLFKKIHISSNIYVNEKYQEFLRPNSFCKKTTLIKEVIQWTLMEFKKRGEIFDTVCLAYPTAPLLDEKDFKKACKKFEKNKKFPLLSVSKFCPSIDEAMVKIKNLVKPKNEVKFYQDSKRHEDYYFDTGSFVFFPSNYFYNKKNKSSSIIKSFVPFILPRNKSVDINTKEDLNFLKHLIKIK